MTTTTTLDVERPASIADDATPGEVLPDHDTYRWIRRSRDEQAARKAAAKLGATRLFLFPGTPSRAPCFYVGIPRGRS